jgi:hypothetical protein
MVALSPAEEIHPAELTDVLHPEVDPLRARYEQMSSHELEQIIDARDDFEDARFLGSKLLGGIIYRLKHDNIPLQREYDSAFGVYWSRVSSNPNH